MVAPIADLCDAMSEPTDGIVDFVPPLRDKPKETDGIAQALVIFCQTTIASHAAEKENK